MNRRGFTLVELLATLVILGVIVSIVLVSFNYDLRGAKDKTEDVFIETLKDATEMYIDSDGKKLTFSEICTFSKTHGDVKLYKASERLTFGDVINSEYIPLVDSELVNPANEEEKCDSSASVSIYRDDDYVYYYRIDVKGLDCLEIDEEYITNLPSTPSGCSL